MNASQLRYFVESKRPESKFFSRENMKFAGDTMANFGVRSARVVSSYDVNGNYVGDGKGVAFDVWALYRKRATKKGLGAGTFAYFCKDTGAQLHCVKEI